MINTVNLLAADPGAGQGYQTIIMMVLMFVIFWVVLIRPQQKQRKELAAKQSAMKKGDKVVTISGLHGTINAVSDHTVSLKVADGIFMKFDKVAVAAVNPEKKKAAEPRRTGG